MLTDVQIRKAKPTDKPQRLSDSNGLYLLINPKGSKWWRLDYSINGKRKTLSLGTYPTVTLSDVRNKAIEARQQVAKGINPSDTRKAAKATQRAKIENEKRVDAGLPVIDSFACVAMDWYENHMTAKSSSYQANVKAHLHKDLFPFIGNVSLAVVKQSNCLKS